MHGTRSVTDVRPSVGVTTAAASSARFWRIVLGAIVLVALAIRIAIVVFRAGAPIDMEGANYARLAQNIHDGLGYVSIRGTVGTEYSPLYPLAIAALLPLVPDAQLGGTLIAALSGTLLVAAVWLLAREIYDVRVATIAAILTAVMPILVALGTTVYAETLFDALFVLALWWFVRALRAGSMRDAALAGSAFSLASLARPEGALFVVAGAAALAFVALWSRTFARAAATFCVCAFVIVAPYVVFTYLTSGQIFYEGKARINAAEAQGLRAGRDYLEVADAVDRDGRAVGPEIDLRFHDPRGRPPAPGLRERLDLILGAELRHWRDLEYAFRSPDFGTWLIVALALVGLARSDRSRNAMRDQLVLLIAAVILYVALGTLWHFWDRYGAAFLVLAIVWAAKGTSILDASLRSVRAGTLCAAALVALALVVDVREAGASRDAPERAAGAWIARHGGAARIIDVTNVAAYYAHANWLPPPYAPEPAARAFMTRTAPDYLVLDERRRSDYPLLARWFDTGPPRADASLVFRAQGERGALRIYRWRNGRER